MSLTSRMLCKAFTLADNQKNKGQTTPEDIVRYDNIVYGPDFKWHVLDVYRPRNVGENLPVIIDVHGGGWVYGDKDVYQYYCMSLARRGFAVVNFTYRLAPDYIFPSSM
ncbi:MAG: alpha/beta hydrolase, partial [Spirochaetales bacterium]|nr:alpha/beta hydrolase [Spirochaetales bacterium]